MRNLLFLAQVTPQGITFWGVLSWVLPILCVYCLYEGVTMLIKAGKNREKEERGGDTLWAIVVGLAPIIMYGLMLRFTPLDLPFAGDLPF